MFWNGAECFSGVFQDAIQAHKAQSRKQFYNEAFHLPGNSLITAHAAEVRHQVQGAKNPLWGWVAGDSWFGSAFSAIEVRVDFIVYFT
jgi:hypothetical protein